MAYKREGQWIATWSEQGRRRTKSCADRTTAIAVERHMRGREKLIEIGATTRRDAEIATKSKTKASDVVDRYIAELVGTRPTTAYSTEAKRLAKASLGQFNRIGEVNGERVVSWLDSEGRRKHWSPRTHNAYLKAAKAVTRWAEAKDYITRDPLRSLRLLEDAANTKPRRALTVGEFQRLAGWRRYNDLLFCVFTGLRWTEATGIRFMDLDFKRRIITVPKGVGKRDRNVNSLIPMASILVEPLRARGAIGRASVIRSVPGHRTWRRNIEVRGITFETDRGLCVASSLRPTFCQWLAEAGVDNDTRMRLRRDKGMLVEFIYTDRDRLLDQMRQSLERTVRWYRRQVERVKVTA